MPDMNKNHVYTSRNLGPIAGQIGIRLSRQPYITWLLRRPDTLNHAP